MVKADARRKTIEMPTLMEIYLVRHGIASDQENYTNDEERPLTNKGLQKTSQVAKRLYQLGLRFDLILTSPLVRARQTAELLQSAGLSSQIEESSYLAPASDIHAGLSWLEKWRSQASDSKGLALVGHQPDLGSWAEILVWGEAKEKLSLKKAGVIGLTVPETESLVGRGQLFWLTAPKLML